MAPRRQSLADNVRPQSADLVTNHPPVTPAQSSNNNNGNSFRRPNADNLKQQRLTAWQPMLSAKTVIPFFALLGAVFVPIGVWMLIVSLHQKEIIIDYTNCYSTTQQSHLYSRTQCSLVLKPPATCTCELTFTLDLDGMQGDVNIYYALDNFFQNHRHYVRSRDDYQLLGHLEDGKVSADCAPFDKDDHQTPIAPCGAMANSMFNDTFVLVYEGPLSRAGALQTNKNPLPPPHSEVHLLRTGIAWWSDKQVKFRNPKNWADFQRYARPQNWQKNITELDIEIPSNNGFLNEDFIVWMRPAAFSNFRKLHRRLDRAPHSPYADGLPSGNYRVYVKYNFPVVSFEGRKKFIVSTASWLGGKNPLIGSGYVAVGGVCILLAIVFLFLHRKWGSSMSRDFAEGDAPPRRLRRHERVAEEE